MLFSPSPWIVCFSFPSFVGLFLWVFLINFQILFFYAWNLIVELGCVILWNFFLNIWLIGLFLLWYISLSLFYSHVHIQCFSEQFFFLFNFFDRVVFSQVKLLSCFVIYQRFMPTRMIKVMITREFMFSI